MKLTLIAVAALAVSGGAIAQDKQKLQLPAQELQLPDQVRIPPGKQPQLEAVLDSSTTERAAGCIKHQVYNVQGLNRVSTMFVLATSSGDMTFNFEGTAIRYIPEGDPIPLASSLETKRWERILTTLERAAAADKPLLIDYNMPSREVFGMFVQWSENCAP